MDKIGLFWYNKSTGSLAQLARAPRLHRGGQEFEPLATHHFLLQKTQKGEASDLASLDASILTTHHFLLHEMCYFFFLPVPPRILRILQASLIVSSKLSWILIFLKDSRMTGMTSLN